MLSWVKVLLTSSRNRHQLQTIDPPLDRDPQSQTQFSTRLHLFLVACPLNSLNSQTSFVTGQPWDFGCVVVGRSTWHRRPVSTNHTHFSTLITDSTRDCVLHRRIFVGRCPCLLAIVTRPNARQSQEIVACARTHCFWR